jgi:hypothetical protein
MKKTKDLLMSDYNKNGEYLSLVCPDNENHGKLLKDRDDIRKELIQIEIAQMEAEIKQAEINAENKREKVRNGIVIGTFTITSMISIWAVLKTFKFDQEGTVTSTLGRGILSGLIPKFKK